MSKGKRVKKNSRIDDEDEFIPKAFKKEKIESKKEETNNKKHRKKEKNRKLQKEKRGIKSKIKRTIITVIAFIIVITGVSTAISTNRWKSLAKDMMINENSIVKDIDGNTIAELGSERKNVKVALNNIPDNLKNAYVAIEDERFYKHHGVDMKRTSSAIASYIIHFGKSSFGGSTITQQLVKNLTGDSTDSINRKVNEWWKAWQLETFLTKDEILESYLNVIYVGPNMYGVGTGTKYYFNKNVDELTLEEMAFLAGINHSPNSYNPFEGNDNSEKINKRTKIVLAKMLELKYINQSDYDNAVSKVDQGFKFQKGTINSGNGVYSYHTDALINEVTEEISNKYRVSETFTSNYINMSGLTIYSTQDSNVQRKVNSEFEKSKYKLTSNNGKDTSQAAMVIIDHETGYVRACAGGLGEKTAARSLNRATQSVRQTGSSIKPISVLAPAIDKKIITASSVFDDTQREFEGGFNPDDYSNQLGKITVRRAVESSQNIPFVEIMEKVKPQNAIKYLKKMGITTLTEEDNNLVLSLGGLERGISPLEMAGAYATIANDGQYIEPTFYSKIVNASGKTIIKTKQKKRRVFSKEVAFILKNLLTQPVKGQNGTATYCNIPGMDVAAKTGTTDENYDRWLCGFTNYYTAVTWYGYDINESIEYYGKNPAGLIWANVMNNVHSGLKSSKFEKPNGVKAIRVCSETGKKANSGCPSSYEEYFLWLTEPENCHEHSGQEVTNNQNRIVNKSNQTKSNETRGPTLEEEEKIENTNTTNINNDTQNNTRQTSEPSTTTDITNNTNINSNTNRDENPSSTIPDTPAITPDTTTNDGTSTITTESTSYTN